MAAARDDLSLERTAAGLTVHASAWRGARTAEARFLAPPGARLAVLLSGRLEMALDGAEFAVEAREGPVAVFWSAPDAVDVVRVDRGGAGAVKVQLGVPQGWLAAEALSPAMSAALEGWAAPTVCPAAPALAVAAANHLRAAPANGLGAFLARERFAIEALASLGERLGEAWPPGGPPPRLEVARAHIERTAVSRPSLREIARAVGMSPSVLQRRFRNAYGGSVIAFQRAVALDVARRALEERAVTVAEAAALAGYDHAANFATAFARRHGAPPSALRGRARETGRVRFDGRDGGPGG
ncbi:helix-turn-helix transcriptional regulator [Rubrimonas cliftonensis]|uniref:helix-turn-helix transcriptional regulator n=1 Tax=Rubrimonas cliftonensis TaxID=89524 RepID=UPI0011148D20|nr:AraC family transcriptional regulator [Rubrimonas cliftonensis]